jgi:hypothetical protein
VLVEEPDERADGARRVVVLGFAEEQCAPAFEIAQVDVIAQGCADHPPGGADSEDHLRLRVVPLGSGMDTDLRSGADRGHRLRFGEDFGVGTNADLEVLRPDAAPDQDLLQRLGVGGARPDVVQTLSNHAENRLPKAVRARGIAARLLLDDTFQEAGDERHTGCLDRLQVARREQPRSCLIPVVGIGIREHVGQRADPGQRAGGANR